MSATVALAGLAAKVDAPPFPGVDASSDAIQEWIVDIMRRVGERLNDPRLVYRADTNRRREWAERFGFFWLPCPICAEYFSGAEHSSASTSLFTSAGSGQIVCPKPGCSIEAARRNRENGFVPPLH